jgi:hypothetical protein
MSHSCRRSRAPTDDEFNAFLLAACIYHSRIVTKWCQRSCRESEPDEVAFRAIREIAHAIDVDNVEAREAFMKFRDEIFDINEEIRREGYEKKFREEERRWKEWQEESRRGLFSRLWRRINR